MITTKTAKLRERAQNKVIDSPENWSARGESIVALPEYEEIDDGGTEYLIKAFNGETIATEA